MAHAGNRVFAASLYRWQLRLRCEFMSLAMKRIPRRGCFSITPRWLKEAKRTDSLRGVYLRHSTDWSETMLLALRIQMSHQVVQQHGLRPNRIAPVCPHEGRSQLTLSRPSWGYRETASPRYRNRQDGMRINCNIASNIWTGEQD